MKTKTALLLGLALFVSVNAPMAQTDAQSTPVVRGPMWKLSPEQQAARQQQMQSTLEQMRQKKAAGTLSETEKAWLEQVELAGGLCVNGVPRGGCGMGLGNGPRNGTGPRAQMGTCPVAGNTNAAATLAPYGRGFGRGQAVNGGWARRGMGLPNGTGPRARMGMCPLAKDADTAVMPAFNARTLGKGEAWNQGQGAGMVLCNGTCPLLSTPAKK